MNKMKLTYRHDRGFTTVATPGFGQLFTVAVKRNGVCTSEYTFIFDCRDFATVTGDNAAFREFCQWVAPAALEVLKERRQAYAAEKAVVKGMLSHGKEVLAKAGIDCWTDDDRLVLTDKAVAKLVALLKQVQA
jgi:hypothetical protein